MKLEIDTVCTTACRLTLQKYSILHSELFRCRHSTRQSHGLFALAKHLYMPLSYRDWTTEMQHWPVFRPACLTVSSPSTRQRGRSPVSVVRSILQMLSPVSTGSERPSASSLNWPSSSTELFTALHLGTYRTSFSTSLIRRRDAEAGCARRPPVSSKSARRDLLQLAIARLLLPARDCGVWNSLPIIR